MAENILPKSAPFKEYIKVLFSLDENRLSEALSALDASGHTFSTKFVKGKFGLDQETAKKVRTVLLNCVYHMRKDSPDMGKVKNELLEMGVEATRADQFIQKVSSLKPDTVAACQDLYEIADHAYEFGHLLGFSYDVVYPFISDKNHKLFPLVRMHLSAHGHRTTHEVEMNLDANTFEELLANLEELHSQLKTSSASIKMIAKDNFVDPVEERD